MNIVARGQIWSYISNNGCQRRRVRIRRVTETRAYCFDLKTRKNLDVSISVFKRGLRGAKCETEVKSVTKATSRMLRAVLMREMGSSYEEIGEEFGVHPGTVERWLLDMKRAAATQ